MSDFVQSQQLSPELEHPLNMTTSLEPTPTFSSSPETNNSQDDTIVSIEDLKERLCDYFNGITALGEFATIKPLTTWVDPQIRLLQTESSPELEIAVPLGTQDASKLIKAAHQAPFGRGEETIVDTEIRNTWELNPSQFVLSKDWQMYVDTLMTSACEDLGVRNTTVKAELYKMLLYEKGAMFKPHADSEKSPGMFGTLVISLPSAHWGGRVVVTHNRQRLLLQTHTHDYLAWYSDVIHEVQEVTSGIRWVLTYNLIQEDFACPISAANADRELRSILTDWKRSRSLGSDSFDKMLYLMDHQYTDASIKLSSLKGADHLRALRLFSVCGEYGFSLYLACLEKEVLGSAGDDGGYSHDPWDEDELEDDSYGRKKIGENYYTLGEIFEESLKMTRVVDVEGNVLATDLDTKEDDIVQLEPFEGRDPDEDAYEGYTGNAGATSTHWYKNSVIVLVPNDRIVDVFLTKDQEYKYGSVSMNEKLMTVLIHLVRRFQLTPDALGDGLRQGLRQLGNIISEDKRENIRTHGLAPRLYTDDTISEVIIACVRYGHFDVLPDLVASCETGISDAALHSLRDLRNKLGFERAKHIFNIVVKTHKNVSRKYRALSILLGEEAMNVKDPANTALEVQSWVDTSLAEIFSSLGPLSNEDACVTAKLAALDASGSLLENCMLPKIREHAQSMSPEKAAWMMMFLCRIFEFWSSPPENLVRTYGTLLELTIPHFTLRKARSPQPQPRRGYSYGSRGTVKPQEDTRSPAFDGKILSAVLGQCQEFQFDAFAQALMLRISTETTSMDPDDFHITILPLLLGLITSFEQGKDRLDMYKPLFQTCLSNFVSRYVGQKPVRISWSKPPVRCSCMDCEDLNRFLQSAVEQVGRFKIGKNRRLHIHIQLDSFTDCTHQTERFGNPQTLVVSKKGESLEQRLAGWRAKTQAAVAWFTTLRISGPSTNPRDLLRELLADEYNNILTLQARPQHARRTDSNSATASSIPNSTLGGIAAQGQNQIGPSQIIGQKRKAVVIDLTEE